MTRGPKKDAIFEPVPRSFRPGFRTFIVTLVILCLLILAYAGWNLYLLASGDSPTKPSKTCVAQVIFHKTGQTHTCALGQFTEYKKGTCWVSSRSGVMTIYTDDNGAFVASTNWTVTSCTPCLVIEANPKAQGN